MLATSEKLQKAYMLNEKFLLTAVIIKPSFFVVKVGFLP